MPTKFKCKKCGYVKTEEPSEADINFARKTSAKKLVAIWVCPKCKTDNSTEIQIPE